MPDNDTQIYGGAFNLARQIFSSEIWLTKPATWKILWIYILGKVNHKPTKQFERGEGFFNFTQEIRQIGIDITSDKIKSFCQYARASQMIDTKKTTRGIIIKVLNYNKYQDFNNFKTTTKTTSKPQQNHDRTTTINKNDKNDKNDKKDKNIVATPPDEVNLLLNFFKETVNPHIGFGNKTERKACSDLLKAYGLDWVKQSLAFLEEKRKTDKYLPTITTPYELWTKWAKIKQHLDTQQGNRIKIWKPSQTK